MQNKNTDKQGFSTVNPDEERDMAAKGGPTTSLGIADDAHDVSHPYDEDTQTQLAAKSTEKKKDGETLNDDWKTGTDKKKTGENMNPGKSQGSRNDDDSTNSNPGRLNYSKSKKATSDAGRMDSQRSNDMDEE